MLKAAKRARVARSKAAQTETVRLHRSLSM